jgi:hypothetical protein
LSQSLSQMSCRGILERPFVDPERREKRRSEAGRHRNQPKFPLPAPLDSALSSALSRLKSVSPSLLVRCGLFGVAVEVRSSWLIRAAGRARRAVKRPRGAVEGRREALWMMRSSSSRSAAEDGRSGRQHGKLEEGVEGGRLGAAGTSWAASCSFRWTSTSRNGHVRR